MASKGVRSVSPTPAPLGRLILRAPDGTEQDLGEVWQLSVDNAVVQTQSMKGVWETLLTGERTIHARTFIRASHAGRVT